MKNNLSNLDLYIDRLKLSDRNPLVYGGEMFVTSAAPTYLHRHDGLEIGYCHSGTGMFIVDERIMPYAAGDACIIGEMQFHIAQSASIGPSRWSFIMIDPACFQPSRSFAEDVLPVLPKKGPGVVRVHDDPFFCRLTQEIVAELDEKRPHNREVVAGLIAALLVLTQRLNAESSDIDSTKIETISPAMQYIAENYNSPIAMSTLADICCISQTHLRRTFQSALGESPSNYIARLRINMAAVMLLGSQMSVLSIANSVGYITLSSFNRQFRRIMGMSPRQFRVSR